MKNANLIFLILCIFSTPLIIAQTPEWVHATKGEGTTEHNANHVMLDADRNVYVAGNFQATMQFSDMDFELNGVEGVNTYLYKRSYDGELLWALAVGGEAPVNDIYDMGIDNDGYIYLVGQFSGVMEVGSGGDPPATLTSNGMNDAFILKYSPAGILMGAHNVGGTLSDNFTAISFDSDNQIILAGNFHGQVDFDLSDETHSENCTGLVLIKYSEDFELISVLTMNSGFTHVTNINVNAAGETTFGGYFKDYVALHNLHGIPPDIYEYEYIMGFIIKLNSDYELTVVMGVFSNTGPQYIRDMYFTPSGDIYIAGDISESARFTNNPFTNHTVNSNSGSRDLFFAKVSPEGEFKWIKSMGGAGDEYMTGISLDNNGNILLAGTYAQTVDFNPGLDTAEFTAEGTSSAFVSAYTIDGDYLNTFTFENPDGNTNSGMALNPSGGIYLTGSFMTSIDFDPTQPDFAFTSEWEDSYLLKLGESPVGIHKANGVNSISIYPNPTRDIIHIQAPSIQKLEVYNIYGKLVLSKAAMAFGDRHTLGISHLPAGTYILSLTANDGFVGSDKFVIIR